MGPAIITLVLAGVILILGIVMLNELATSDVVGGPSSSTAANDTAWKQANLTMAGMASFADFWEIIVLAIVISVVIGLLLVVFGGRRAR